MNSIQNNKSNEETQDSDSTFIYEVQERTHEWILRKHKEEREKDG